jgi:hypothetical protein
MINEHKKGVKAMKYTTKTKNPVAKAHQTIGSGSGQHKDKKKAETDVRGQKHKAKELAEHGIMQGVSRAVTSMIEDAEKGFNAEYDDEAGMADNNLETLKRAVEGLDDMISTGDNLPEWCQEKIAVAKSMLVTVWDYMQSEENSLAEGFPKDPNAPKLVQDRKTGKWYDPNKEFEKKMNSPEVMAQMKRLAQKEGSDNQEIGQQMANDGVTYSPEKEKEIINLMSQYMQKAGMSSKQIRYLLSYDEDYISDQLSFLPRQGVKEGVAGPKKCWPRHRKVGTQPGTGKNKGKRVNDCEKIKESSDEWYRLRLDTLLEEKLKK